MNSQDEIRTSLAGFLEKIMQSGSYVGANVARDPYKWNPFSVLGAYPDPSAYVSNSTYEKTPFGLKKDENYCDKVDLQNLNNPHIMFNKESAIFTDVDKTRNLYQKIS